MEYGILVVEGEDEMMYQILGSVWSVKETLELVANYERNMGPDSDDANIPPFAYVIHRRGPGGYYTRRENISTALHPISPQSPFGRPHVLP